MARKKATDGTPLDPKADGAAVASPLDAATDTALETPADGEPGEQTGETEAERKQSIFISAGVYRDAREKLKKIAEKNDSVIVSFSGGKDSLACMDLAVRNFQRVVAMFMYAVPGLEFIERDLAVLQKLWPQVPLVRYPHWGVIRAIKAGAYRPTHWKLAQSLPDLTVIDIYNLVRADLGINCVIHGGKAADSMWRRRSMVATAQDWLIYPLSNWNKWHVLGYLRHNKIPIPQASADAKGTASGVDLSTPSVLWMYDNHPEDFKKLELLFPYVGAIVKRREWYGVS
jgi:hypothetical protein